jgi:hypothetical protein
MALSGFVWFLQRFSIICAALLAQKISFKILVFDQFYLLLYLAPVNC